MNWEAIGAVGEMVGAAAVFVSIVYLSIQIRSNTNATKASAGFEAAHSWATSNEVILGLEPALKSKAQESYQVNRSWNDFTPEERLDLSLLTRILFQKLEGQYHLLKYGFLDAGLWSKRSQWAASLIALPFYREWWEQEKRQNIYSDEFVKALEAIEPRELQAAGVVDAVPATPSE